METAEDSGQSQSQTLLEDIPSVPELVKDKDLPEDEDDDKPLGKVVFL